MSGEGVMFDDRARGVFAGLADWMIPAADGMPSASQAGAAGEWLDAVLAARPDLAQPLRALVDRVGDAEPATAIADLQANDPDGFGLLAEVVPNAYFMNPTVRELVAYPGQVGLDVDLAWPPDWLDLLEPVMERGPIYRETDPVAPAAEVPA
jgi:hypothetical protein